MRSRSHPPALVCLCSLEGAQFQTCRIRTGLPRTARADRGVGPHRNDRRARFRSPYRMTLVRGTKARRGEGRLLVWARALCLF